MGDSNLTKSSDLDAKIKQKEIERAKDYTDSLISAAYTINRIHDNRLDLATVILQLVGDSRRIIDGNTRELEITLLTQAQTLNTLFHHMLGQAVNCQMVNHLQALTDIALRAQNQSRKTLATLAELKHPKRATFIKQQNNAVNQQVNNPLQPTNSKISENPANELVSEVKHAKMDDGRKVNPISANKKSEAMVTLHGSANKRGEIKK